MANIVGLVFVASQFRQSIGFGHFFANKRFVGFDNFSHLFFDSLKIGRPNRLIKVNIIVKSVFNGWAINQFCIRPNTTYSFSHYVGAAMAHQFKTLVIFEGDNLKF